MSQRDRVRLSQALDENASKRTEQRQEATQQSDTPAASAGSENAILQLQRRVGNRAVQRLLANRVQRAAYEEGGPLNSEISDEINSKRGSGQRLDGSIQAQMSENMGYDFSDVTVHTDSQSDKLNKDVGAKAFTTGSDIFFSEGSYQPNSSSGQELLAHELTHVVQQDGSAPSGDLTLGPAQDSYESEADSMAQTITSGATASAQAMRDDTVQREGEEEEMMQAKRDPDIQRMEEEEMMQAKRDPDIQRMGEEEEMMQAKRDPDVQRESTEDEMLAG